MIFKNKSTPFIKYITVQYIIQFMFALSLFFAVAYTNLWE